MKGPFLVAPLALIIAAPLAAQNATTPVEEPTEGQPAAEATSATQAPPTRGFDAADWDLEGTDLKVEDGWVMGQLDNGLRYIIQQNATPSGTALVRMEVDAGRFAQRDNERGLAHYVEHMAFNGSTNVPEGEMIKLLEREGLAFGADTNAETNFHYTQYKLDLPRNDLELLDTALFLMRETASELTFDPEAVDRERGVLLAERRDGNTFARLNFADQIDFLVPGSRLSEHFPVDGREDVATADAATLRGFWERNYVPAKTTVIVVGDFDASEVEAAITKRFASWEAKDAEAQPGAGPVDIERGGETHVYVDPALDARITMTRYAPWTDRPDTDANRRENTLRSIGNAILSRRFTRLTRGENPPFRGAGYSSSDVFEAARETTLSVAAIEGRWEEGMAAAIATYRQFFEFGVTQAEIDEQIARRRTGNENAVKGSATRSHNSFVGRAIRLTRNQQVPTSPKDNLARFEEVAKIATPEAVLSAMRRASAPLVDPLIRYQGRTEPEGGADAVRSAWQTAIDAPVVPLKEAAVAEWAYTDFGDAGTIVSDTVSEKLDIRQIVFDNGVKLNLKQTDLADDRVSVSVEIDGGSHLNTREAPLNTALLPLFPAGGLGAHSQDELQSIFAGRSASFSIGAQADRFVVNRGTTPRDLELQLQLITAYLTDPAYRPEPITRFRNGLDDFYARLTATPASVLGVESDPILNDNDPRFRVPERDTFVALDFDVLRNAIADRLTNGAMEVALVGDFDEDTAIALVGKTLGALPQRETEFRRYEESRQRSFTDARGGYTLFHDGEANQALVSYVWPTRDYWDAVETVELNLLRAVVAIQMTDALREEFGKAYSPIVSSSQSRHYDGFGTFTIRAGVEVSEVADTQDVIYNSITKMRTEPISDDILQRAREPILQGLDNALKSNGSWMSYVRRAQTEPVIIDRFLAARDRYEAVTAERLQEVAAQYLAEEDAVRFVVVPRALGEPEAVVDSGSD